MDKAVKEIKEKVVPILKEQNVSKAGLFGSYARGEQTKRSDVDLLVEINEDIGLNEFIGLKLKLEKQLKKKVDLVEYCMIRKELKDSILNDEIRLI